MAGSFTLSISSLSAVGIGGTRRAEAQEITDMVNRAMQVFAAGLNTSVTFKDRNGNTAGTISWTPVNPV